MTSVTTVASVVAFVPQGLSLNLLRTRLGAPGRGCGGRVFHVRQVGNRVGQCLGADGLDEMHLKTGGQDASTLVGSGARGDRGRWNARLAANRLRADVPKQPV